MTKSKINSFKRDETYFLFILDLVKNAVQKGHTTINLDGLAVNGGWILRDHYSNQEITQQEFQWLWHCLVYISSNGNFSKKYWGRAYNYYSSKYYNYNRQEIEKEYLEFFQVFQLNFCALLIEKRKFETLNYILQYSTSYPPRYYLFPNNIETILKLYIQIADPHSITYRNKYGSFHFQNPNIDNYGMPLQHNDYVGQFLVILTFKAHHRGIIRDLIPTSFSDQNIAYQLEGMLSHMKFQFDSLIHDNELIKKLNLIDYVEDNNLKIDSFIEGLGDLIDSSKDSHEREGDISEKVSQFNIETEVIIDKIISALSEFISDECDGEIESEKDYTKIYLSGHKTEFRRKTFLNETSSIGFDTVLANIVSEEIIKFFEYFFTSNKIETYLINESDLLKAIKELEIDSKVSMVSFNDNVNYKPENFEGNFNFIDSRNHNINDSLFILNDVDKPKLRFLPISEKQKFANDAKEFAISHNNYNIYWGLLDLLELETSAQSKFLEKEETLEPIVIAFIVFNLQMVWKSKGKVIQLRINQDYREQGILNDISDIEKF